jgi:glycosyltransferase involved in cell wall biosynthesis
MIKILFLSKESRGGVETFLNQMDRLDNQVFEKRYCFYKYDKIPEKKSNYKYFYNNYPDEVVFSLHKVIRFCINIFLSIKEIWSYRPDIIFTCDFYSLIIASVVKVTSFYSAKYVAIINNNMSYIVGIKPGLYYKKLLKTFVTFSSYIMNGFVFTSTRMMLDFIKFFGGVKNKMIYIPHSVDLRGVLLKTKEALEEKHKNILSEKNKKIFYVGRLDDQKDVVTIVEALPHVKDKKAKLYIVGDGTEKERIIEDSKLLGVDNRVTFFGWQRNIYKYLKHADVFVFASLFEGFAMVIVEAMALGIPVIATDTPFGPSEILNNKYGFLVPMYDFTAISKKINMLLGSRVLRKKYSKLSLERSKIFDEKIMIKSYEKYLKSIVKHD